MTKIKFLKGINDWDVASFIHRNGGMMNEFDTFFKIWTEEQDPSLIFKYGDVITFDGKFHIEHY